MCVVMSTSTVGVKWIILLRMLVELSRTAEEYLLLVTVKRNVGYESDVAYGLDSDGESFGKCT